MANITKEEMMAVLQAAEIEVPVSATMAQIKRLYSEIQRKVEIIEHKEADGISEADNLQSQMAQVDMQIELARKKQ